MSLIELRYATAGGSHKQLQFRERGLQCDASGAFAGVSEPGDWQVVPTVYDKAEVNPRFDPDANPTQWWCPAFCPVTFQPFFAWLFHPTKGWLPTYGGPFDSYTIPAPDVSQLKDKDRKRHDVELERLRYDHDEGEWRLNEVEDPALRVVDEEWLLALTEHYDQTQTSEPG